eukprot:3877504-Prymnesium_polylepis.1
MGGMLTIPADPCAMGQLHSALRRRAVERASTTRATHSCAPGAQTIAHTCATRPCPGALHSPSPKT